MRTYDQLIVEYLKRLDSGQPVSAADFIAENPEYSDELRVFFAKLSAFDGGDRTVRLGEFRIVRELGRGGMGVVYEAVQESLERRVALKVLHAPAAADVQKRKRFQNEVQAVASLRHDNIVPVFSVGEQDGHHFYAMQLIEGLPLDRVLATARTMVFPSTRGANGGLSKSPASQISVATNADFASETLASGLFSDTEPRRFGRAMELLETVARGLDYAHRKGIIHRDIKPSNLLLESNNQIWITDFGLALLDEEGTITATGEVLGTVQYMSPEQAMGRHADVDRRSDVYSLGVVMYQLLTGELPFRGQHQMVLHQLVHDDPTPLRQLSLRVPSDLETICLKCLRKEPAQRYASAGDLADDLRRYLNMEPILARPVRTWQRVAKWIRRRPLTAAMLAISLAAVVATVGLSLRHAHVVTELVHELEVAVNQRELAALEAKEQADLVRSRSYTSGLKRAHEAWSGGDLRQYEDLLIDQFKNMDPKSPPELEWKFLWRLGHPVPTHTESIASRLYGLTLAPAHDLYALVGSDGFVRVRRLSTHEQLAEFNAGQGEVNGVSISSTAELLVTAGDDGTVRIWDWRTGQMKKLINAHQDLAFHALFTPDDQRLITCGRKSEIRVWDVQSGDHVGTLTGHTRGVEQIVLSPDQKYIASASADRWVKIWDLQDFEEVDAFEVEGDAMCLAYSPDGKTLHIGDRKRNVFAWEIGRGKAWSISNLDTIHSLAVHPRTQEIVIGDATGAVHFYDPREERFTQRHRIHQDRVFSMAFTPKGEQLLSVGRDGRVHASWTGGGPFGEQINTRPANSLSFGSPQRVFGTIRDRGDVFVAERGQPANVMDSDYNWQQATASEFGDRLIAVAETGQIRLFDLTNNATVFTWAFPPSTKRYPLPAAISSDGRRVAVSPGHHILIVGATGEQEMVVEAEDCDVLDLSPDGTFLAFEQEDDFFVIDLVSNRRFGPFIGHESRIMDLKFLPGQTQIASAGIDRTVRLWDISTGKQIRAVDVHKNRVEEVLFTKSENTMISHDVEQLGFYDVASGQTYYMHTMGREGDSILAVAIAPDESWMVITTAKGGNHMIDLTYDDEPQLQALKATKSQP